jgi:hypothetical protein
MNILFVLFSAILITAAGLLLIFGLTGTPLIETKKDDTLMSRDGNTDVVYGYQTKPSFRPLTTVTSMRSFKYESVNKRITINGKSDMNDWDVKYPLNFTHARIDNTYIYKFNHPNSSDSSGFFVDDLDKALENQPKDLSFNKMEFGMFF